MATKTEISKWFDRGVSYPENTHMIVVCDTYNYENYPVFVKDSENVRDIYSEYNGENMQRVEEVYNLSMDKEKQLNSGPAFNF